MDCAWLQPAGFVEGSRVTEGDAKKRRELLAEFLWWLFDGFLIPLLKVGAGHLRRLAARAHDLPSLADHLLRH